MDDLGFSLETAFLGRAQALMERAAGVEAQIKPDGSEKSAGDDESEDVMVEHLKLHRPNDAIYSEERGWAVPQTRAANGPGRPRVWVLDPIDGSHNYLRGDPADPDPAWAVVVGLDEVDDNGLLVPTLGTIVSANGTWVAGSGETGLRCSPHVERKPWWPTNYRLAVSLPRDGDRLDVHRRYTTALAGALPNAADLRYRGSSALAFRDVALGDLEAYVTIEPQRQDLDPGLALIAAAGGVHTSTSRSPGYPYMYAAPHKLSPTSPASSPYRSAPRVSPRLGESLVNDRHLPVRGGNYRLGKRLRGCAAVRMEVNLRRVAIG